MAQGSHCHCAESAFYYLGCNLQAVLYRGGLKVAAPIAGKDAAADACRKRVHTLFTIGKCGKVCKCVELLQHTGSVWVWLCLANSLIVPEKFCFFSCCGFLMAGGLVVFSVCVVLEGGRGVFGHNS